MREVSEASGSLRVYVTAAKQLSYRLLLDHGVGIVYKQPLATTTTGRLLQVSVVPRRLSRSAS